MRGSRRWAGGEKEERQRLMGVDQSPLTGDFPGFVAEETHSGVA